MKPIMKKGRGFLLSLMLLLGVMAAIPAAALAWEGNPYAGLVNTTTPVKFNNKDWYIIADNSTAVDAGSLTLFAKRSFYPIKFGGIGSGVFSYKNSFAKYTLDNETESGGSFAGVAGAIKVVTLSDIGCSAKLYLLSMDEANALPQKTIRAVEEDDFNLGGVQGYWLRTVNSNEGKACWTDGRHVNLTVCKDPEETLLIRPALQLNLSAVNFAADTRTFTVRQNAVTVAAGANMTRTSGDENQTVNVGNVMTAVVYMANEGYYFPTGYSVADANGITVTRDSYTQITVSGTPTANATIILTAATAKTKPDVPAAGKVDCTTAENNDGKLTGVTTAMEYRKSDADSWMDGTGSDITGLTPGTYCIRVKATDTTLASDEQTLTIAAYTAPEQVATPTFSPAGGTYNAAQTVAISCETVGAAVYYTTDGTDPTTGSTVYSDPISVSSTTTVKAIAVKTDMANSAIASATYEINVDPIGHLDRIVGGNGSIDVYGWAFDPSNITQPIDIHVYIGGEAGTSEAEGHNGITANIERPDVDNEHHCGANHGFSGTVATNKRGEQTVYVYAINIGDGSNVCLGNETVTIRMANSTVTKAPTAKTLTCTGSAQELVTAGEAEGGTLRYALGEDADTAPEEGWSADIPTATEAGTYYVWYKVAGDSDHEDTEPAPITAYIAEPFGTPDPPDFDLPDNLDTIRAEAFAGIAAKIVDIPATCTYIGDYAFRNSQLKQIRIPEGCELGTDVFDKCELVFVYGYKDNSEHSAETYCGMPGHENCVFVPLDGD